MEENKKSFWKSVEFWISFSATIIALVALVFSISESRRSREHVRLSTLPRLGVTFWYKEDSAGFSLGNVGLGPARLEWFQVLVDGKAQANWRNMLEQVGFNPVPDYHFIVPTRGHWWQVDNKREIFKVQNRSDIIRIKQVSDRIEITGCYCSIYEECWIFRRSSLELEEVGSCEPSPEIILNAPPPRHTQ